MECLITTAICSYVWSGDWKEAILAGIPARKINKVREETDSQSEAEES